MTKFNHIVGRTLSKSDLRDRYDTIVVGSGIGGLTAAAILGKEGKKVLVLEKHYTAGGFTHMFKRKDWLFEVGVHYIGEMQNPKSPMRIISDYVTEKRLEWVPMTDNYDKVTIGDESFEFPAGEKNLQRALEERFPEEKEAIAKYLELTHKVKAASRPYYLERTLPPGLLKKILSPIMRRKFLSYSTKTTDEVLKNITNNELLRGFLCGLAGDYGLPPAESSFAIHALTANHFLEGANYPLGSGVAIARGIVDTIEENGGQVVTRAGVEEILVENDRVIGVRLEDGQEILSDIIISNAGFTTTYRNLFSEENIRRFELAKQLEGLKPSNTYLCLFVGLNGGKEELGLNQTNNWVCAGGDFHAEYNRFKADPSQNFPMFYYAFPSAKDPKWNEDYPSKSTAEIITGIPYELFKKWQSTHQGRRGDDYEKFKQEFSNRLLAKFIEHNPHLEDKIAYLEVSTPLSVEHFCNYEEGQLYGLDHTPERFSKDISFHGPIKGFYLTGQDTLNVGIAANFISGAFTSLSILGLRKGKHILSFFRNS